jgi:AbrB family looped-hinge helix DNA binding protein
MANGMRSTTVTIDKAGRLVLPKALRDRFRLVPGSQLEVEIREDHLELRPLGMGPALVKVDGWWVHQGVPETGSDLVEALARHRNERLEDIEK